MWQLKHLAIFASVVLAASSASASAIAINGAVLGIATGQVLSMHGICAFVNSFRMTTTGKIVLFVPADKAHRLQKGHRGEASFKLYDNVEIVKIDFKKYGDLPAVKIRHWIYRDWLEANPDVNAVAMTDVRDVVFQQDLWHHPMVELAVFRNEAIFTADLNWTTIFEYGPLSYDTYSAELWPRCFDEESYKVANLRSNPLGGGFHVGSRWAMLEYSKAMIEVMSNLTSDCLLYPHGEQAIHNYLINYKGKLGMLKFPYMKVLNGNSPVDTRTPVKYVDNTVYVVKPGYKDHKPYVLHKIDREEGMMIEINKYLQCETVIYKVEGHGIVNNDAIEASLRSQSR